MKTKKTILAASLMASIFLLNSCATIFSGSSQTVRINSNVPAATVMLNTKQIGYTNQDLRIKRADLDKLIRVSSEGCKTKEYELPIKTNPTFWLNLPMFIVGAGLLTSYIDVAFENHKATEKQIMIQLECDKK
ncbi:MAG: PEGA domain-containing protein [Bacteroidota bacterium]|nr:PEGA domain-containing protein [Bacteroidota bacterium]